jgi:hypothetical protein
LFTESRLPEGLIQAYRETRYLVLGGDGLTLVVDQPSAGLVDLHRQHRADCSAFITACNPFSAKLSREQNAKRQSELAKQLRQRGLPFVDGIGQHPANEWDGEPSFLIFGLALEAAKSLGIRLEQNAILWSGENGVAHLVLLR